MKRIIVALIVIIVTIASYANMSSSATISKQPKALIMYHSDSDEQIEEVRKLDLLIGHFTSDITITQTNDVIENQNIDDYSHVFYFGQRSEDLGEYEIPEISDYNGALFYLGKDIESFEVTSLAGKDYREEAEVLYSDPTAESPYPLIYKKGTTYYLNSENIYDQIGENLGEVLFDFFDAERGTPKKSLRLEDVHPKSDPEKLNEIAEYLKEEKIPYMITVIPVYYNPQTGEEIHLSDSRKLVKVLRKMQDNGASIVMHGYYHQYRDAETGEGFEYWDVNNDRPIYQAKDEKVLFRSDFETNEEYDAHIKNGLEFESGYIKSTITKGVSELVEERLYPLAFEAPHYTMSQSGYKELSTYFTTYIGQIQISDRTYKTTFTPYYDSRPAMLHGMKLYPESLGYIEPENNQAVDEILGAVNHISGFSDSHLSFFYHPYLGLDRLKEVVEEMNKYEDYEWFSLKEESNEVIVDGITVASLNGEVTVDRSLVMELIDKAKKMWWIAFPLGIYAIIVGYSFKNRKNSGENRAS
ncbi:polysaccharide deacetylase family protein [Sporosarcina sp. G11-34]|uniref:polysaccharide deacetylase family protein n=1 Tax=Sporosarcina sp. G11-34 TaxID=2849605 RepID=UPI0022A9CB76|nr:polysaccharide deacetylase family protein [Sporosarcina sp. G11-34]MCZ2256962.1 polysaccharide deacetylase family protein [Sporosarcina sp. G11-34]